MGNSIEIDWTDCDLVERMPGKMGGRPVIKGTRIEPETVIVEAEYGRTDEQIIDSYPTLSLQTVRSLREFADKHQPVL